MVGVKSKVVMQVPDKHGGCGGVEGNGTPGKGTDDKNGRDGRNVITVGFVRV